VHTGATPRFCDVHDATGLIDVASAEPLVGTRTTAIVPVHLYGQACDMDAVLRFAGRHRLAVIEDAAHAHGATYRGRRAGSLGTAAAFSLYPSKNLGALGDGGALCTDDAEVARRARELLGSSRLDALQAAFLRVKLPHLDNWNDARRRAAARYRDRLAPLVRTLTEHPESPCVFHLFPVRVPRRDEVADQLRRAGIEVGIHYSPEVPKQPQFRDRSHPELPVSARWAREELSLPLSESIRAADVERVAACCNEVVEALAC
jgi:dTDP-4-amino-4,6-dideoxygalactose transaminase